MNVHPEHRKYMVFNFQGLLLQHAVLPFGWTGSPHVFVKCMAQLTRLLRSPDMPNRVGDMSPDHWLAARDLLLKREPLPGGYRTTRMLPFCDDFLFLYGSRELALQGAEQVKRTLEFLGLEASPTKCCWVPTQQLEHLGLEL